MEERSTRPVLKSKVRGRYGRCDYLRFDDIASSHMRAGGGRIGKVEVDCRFIFTKSHWGVIGKPKNPAGIIYLDLDFRQPPDCKLESATVSVTLTADDGEEDSIEARSACPVKFTDHYGPKCIRGQETLVQTRRIKNRTPHLELLGYGAGGLGVDKEKIVQTASRWKFAGHIASSNGSRWHNTLRWDLHENTLEREPTHSNLIHTAFALEHNATRFYMTVHVSGKLARFSDKLKSRLKFGDKEGKAEEVVTKIEWTDGYSCQSRLDHIAHDLQFAMELENMSKVPVELPSAMSATFRPTVMGPVSGAITDQEERPDLQHLQQSSPRPWLEPGSVPTDTGEQAWGGETSTYFLPVPTLEDLSMAAGLAPPRPPRPENGCPRRESDQASESSGSTTLVNSETSDQFVQEGQERPGPAGNAVVKKQVNEIQADAGAILLLLHWLQNMGLQLLVLMVGLFPASALEAAVGKDKGTRSSEEFGQLRLMVPHKKPQRERRTEPLKDYDDDSCLPSAGLTPSTGLTPSMARTPNGILRGGGFGRRKRRISVQKEQPRSGTGVDSSIGSR